MNPQNCIPAPPIRVWLDAYCERNEISLGEVARRCAFRTGAVENWERWLARLGAQRTVSVYCVDTMLMVLGGPHLSWFDPIYEAA